MRGCRWVSAAALLALAGCEAGPPPASTWPPADYYVEVRHQKAGLDQRVRFWGDGLALYAEATDWRGGSDVGTARFPVFGRAAAYQLRPKSIRHLSRLLERAGLNDLSGEQGSAGQDDAPMVTIHWRSFGQAGSLWLTGRVDGAAVRVLQVINSYLPESCALQCDGLAIGDPEPRHLVEVPEPVESVPAVLDFYRSRLLALEPANPDLAIEAFALAVAAGDRAYAAQLIERVEAEAGDDQGEAWVVAGGDRPSLVTQLRAVLGS